MRWRIHELSFSFKSSSQRLVLNTDCLIFWYVRYNSMNRQWSFGLSDHEELNRKLRSLRPEVIIDPLPRTVINVLDKARNTKKPVSVNSDQGKFFVLIYFPKLRTYSYVCLMLRSGIELTPVQSHLFLTDLNPGRFTDWGTAPAAGVEKSNKKAFIQLRDTASKNAPRTTKTKHHLPLFNMKTRQQDHCTRDFVRNFFQLRDLNLLCPNLHILARKLTSLQSQFVQWLSLYDIFCLFNVHLLCCKIIDSQSKKCMEKRAKMGLQK